MGQPPTTPLGLPYPMHSSSMPNVHDLDGYNNSSDKGVTIIAATAMDLKWFTHTKTAPSEVEGLGIVSHPHPLRSHPCDNIISQAQFCKNLAVQERRRIKSAEESYERQRQQSWPADTAHLVPAPLAPFGGVKRTDSELHRRHQQNLADLDEELESPVADSDDGDESEGSVYDSDRAESSAQAGSIMRNDKEESESDNEGDQDEPVMILGTVRRESRRPSSIMRLQQEQGLFQQYQRSWSPVSTPPRSRSNTAEGKPSLVRMGTFGPTPPDSPPRDFTQPDAHASATPPPRFSTIVPSVPRRESTIIEHKRRLARANTASSSGSASPRQQQNDAPPPYNTRSILEQATLELQREREQQQQAQLAGTSAKPPPPSRKASRSMAYAHFFVMPPEYYSGSASSTPDRVASPSPKISRVNTASSATSGGSSAKPQSVSYFPPPPVVASPPTVVPPAMTAGLYGPPSVVSPSAPDGAPMAMHKIDSKLFSSPPPSSSVSSFGRKFGRPMSATTNKLKKSKIGENMSKWTTTKVGEPINNFANKLGSEAFWPMTLDKECDKAARILRAFFSEEEVTSMFGFSGESTGKDTSPSPVKERRGSHSPPIQIPPHVMASAKGLAIFTTFRAGGLHLSGARGSGVVVSRLPATPLDVGRKWSPPSAFAVQSLGPGLRSGGGAGSEFNDCILVLTTDAAVDAFTRPKLGLGSEIGVTAGPLLNEGDAKSSNKGRGPDGRGLHSRTKSNDVRIRAEEPILSYTRSTRGVWTGAKASGTIVAVRSEANASFYGSNEPLSVERILNGQVPMPSHGKGSLAADGTVMWPEGGLALVRALRDIEGKM